MLDNYQTLGTPQFEIRYAEEDIRYAQDTLAVLCKALPAVTYYFQVSESFPKVKAVLVPNRNEFDRLVRDLLRVEIEVPSNPARVAQPQRTDMVLLSPSAYESHSVRRYVPDEFERLLIHELVHVAEEYLTSDIEESPRWWSEGLAVYLSGQWRHDDEFRKAALDGIVENQMPSFRQIEASTKLAYEWGWTIVRFLESVYGRDAIVRIVKECSGGAVFSVIGEDAGSLEKHWRGWLLREGRLTSPSCERGSRPRCGSAGCGQRLTGGPQSGDTQLISSHTRRIPPYRVTKPS